MKPAVFQPTRSLFVAFVWWPTFSSFSMSYSTLGSPATLLRDAGRIQTPFWGIRKPSHSCQQKMWNKLSYLLNWHCKKKIPKIFDVFKLKIGREQKHTLDSLLRKSLKHMQVQLLQGLIWLQQDVLPFRTLVTTSGNRVQYNEMVTH